MKWYYSDGMEEHGPFTEDEFQGLINAGRIADDTLVFSSEAGDDWLSYAAVKAERASRSSANLEACECVECGNRFPADEVLEYQGSYVCGDCKDIFFQRIREAGIAHDMFEYGGFWIRLVAKILDGILLNIVTYSLQFALLPLAGGTTSDAATGLVLFLTLLTSLGIPIAYNTFFVGRMGATPGKLALGLKIVRPDGGSVSYLRAFGRYFAEILSSIIFLIGYIMAAFDDEKRTLHDRICDTRVIRNR